MTKQHTNMLNNFFMDVNGLLPKHKIMTISFLFFLLSFWLYNWALACTYTGQNTGACNVDKNAMIMVAAVFIMLSILLTIYCYFIMRRGY